MVVGKDLPLQEVRYFISNGSTVKLLQVSLDMYINVYIYMYC